MARELTFSNFLKELGMRIIAAAIVVGIFFGLGYINQVDFLGLFSLLDSQYGFFAATFLLVGILASGWIMFQQNHQ